MARPPLPLRPLLWIGSSRKGCGEFPPAVQGVLGFQLFPAQAGQHPPLAKPLKGLGGGVVELLGDLDGDAFRAVDAVRFQTSISVLHCFRKKSRRGIATRREDIEPVARRLRDAETRHRRAPEEEGER